MQQYLDEANVTDIDPAPHLRLMSIKSRHKILREEDVQLQRARQQMITAEIKAKQNKLLDLQIQEQEKKNFLLDLQIRQQQQSEKN